MRCILSRDSEVPDAALRQVDGAVTSGPDLSVVVNGIKFPNPFVIGSGAPPAPCIYFARVRSFERIEARQCSTNRGARRGFGDTRHPLERCLSGSLGSWTQKTLYKLRAS